MSEPITITLDRPRQIRWSNRADARLGSLDRPPELRDIASKNSRKGFYALCAFVWAGLVERDLADWEAVADLIKDGDTQSAAWDALYRALVQAGVVADQKKRTETSVSDCSTPGPSA